MSLSYYPYRLIFKKPFKIASVERDGTDNLYLKFEKNGAIGWGEAVFPPYISEDLKSAIKRLKDLKWDFETNEELFELIEENKRILIKEPSLACAMETCLLNWFSAFTERELAKVLGLEKQSKPTSYTIGISSNEDIVKAINETPNAIYFKLKVNEEEIGRIVSCYQSVTDKPFVVDANQGFTSYEKAKQWAEKLYELDVKYFEQPFHKEDFESHNKLSQETLIPIIADESFQRFNDLDKVKKSFSGINVKIIKTGGVFEAKKSLEKARKLGLTTIIGCMSGSSTSINSASSLTSLADFVDLDGVYLIKNDPDLSWF